MEINIKGNSVFIERTEEEPDSIFFERSWFIAKNLQNNSNNYQLLESISKIWVNKKFLGCKYNSETEKLLLQYEL